MDTLSEYSFKGYKMTILFSYRWLVVMFDINIYRAVFIYNTKNHTAKSTVDDVLNRFREDRVPQGKHRSGTYDRKLN